jgi:signal transduction histidine kinase
VQEALTNAARHGASGAELAVSYGDRALELTVENGTQGGEDVVEGHGIVGTRERAALLGGRIEVSRRGGRFRMRAELPYGGDAA